MIRTVLLVCVSIAVSGCKLRSPTQTQATLKSESRAGKFATSDEILAALTEQNKAKSWPSEEQFPAEFINRLSPSDILSDPIIASKETVDERPIFGLSEIASSVDLREHDSPVKDQGGRYTCTAFATAGAMENLAKRRTKKVYDLSEEHLWSFNAPVGNKAQYLVKVLGPATENFILSESDWPYGGAKSSSGSGQIKGKASKLNNWAELMQALSAGNPVILGIRVTSGWLRPKSGVVSNQAPLLQDNLHANHAVVVVGYRYDKRIDGGGYFIFKNSWRALPDGNDDDWPGLWGDSGYGYLPFDYGKTPTTSGGKWEAYALTDISVAEQITDEKRPIIPTNQSKPNLDSSKTSNSSKKSCGDVCDDEHRACLSRAVTRDQWMDCSFARSDCLLKCLGVR